MDTILTRPSAAPVIQSLRNIGYNAQTAIADIIDNSLDANSTDVHITFEYNSGNGYILIYDNGIGMTDEELQVAMTIGSKDPRLERKERELGRFGMGLKTAAFSLGKRLSVVTKSQGIISERCWDLDFVSENNEWELLKQIPEDIKEKIGGLESNGTIVFIDKLDRFTGYDSKKVIQPRSFYGKVARVRKYLEMVFHLKLQNGFNIYLNDNFLIPWDPFLSEHPKTIEGETQVIRVNRKRVKITPYVLPHPSAFKESEYKDASGPKGWRDQQGFYIYREGRLVNFGYWFGMFTKDNYSELVRIKIDFNNNADEDWKIDIKKSSISIPEDAKENLKAIGKYYRQVSKEIMLYRAKPNKKTDRLKGSLHTWELYNDEVNSAYVLNRNHPILIEILKEVNDITRKKLNSYLKLIEWGSPNNLLISESMVKKEEEIQELDENKRIIIIEVANSLVSINDEIDIDLIVNSISLIAGFESINRSTIKSFIEKEVLVKNE
ncbi:ATP-binding protein [Bacillus inaquosorum]|uniref:ATP-binding protein n=1 Tax=Bacillus inaquosorum TaxID=483913 RepID=UPI00227FEAE9|nr:ATP-binding protein [Bacillus inaquosorum]MCY8707577.1 ATP-binding protein [Bacillus inaquosorum]